MRIFEAALDLVDRDGPQALSMRGLGQELGVAAMSLYNHVAGRDDLLDGLSTVMVARIDRSPDGSPPDTLRRFAHGIRTVALAHPAAFQLVGMRPLQVPTALQQVESVLDALRAMELPDEHVVNAYRALVSYSRGFALSEIAGFTLERAAQGAERVIPADLDVEAFPQITRLERQLTRPDHDAAFAFGVETLLAGLAFHRRNYSGPD